MILVNFLGAFDLQVREAVYWSTKNFVGKVFQFNFEESEFECQKC